MSRARLLDGVDALSAADPDLAAVVTRFGPPPLWARRTGFATLVQIILEQQVSLASGRATFGRLRDAWGEVTPGRFATLTTAQVRSAGVTRQKTSYCLGIARQIVDGRLDLRRLGQADDDAARRSLVEIRGVGPWTADIYLLMALGRPDVWPEGDLALATGRPPGQTATAPPRHGAAPTTRDQLGTLAGRRGAHPVAPLPVDAG
jgi:DNA-3-methyladenine glycosylase II